MGGRWGGVLGWAGITVLAGGAVLTVVCLDGYTADGTPTPALAWVAGSAALLALITVVALLLGAADRDGDPERPPGRGRLVSRAASAVLGLGMAVAALPAWYLGSDAGSSARDLPTPIAELWIAVCSISLGLFLVLGASRALQVREWRRALLGAGGGALMVALIVTQTPALTRLATVEHTTAARVLEPAPVPADVTRVGWTWQPEHPVVGVGRGPLGPVVLYQDGLVGLDGATGAELWSYRHPLARNVETGFLPGDDGHARLVHRAHQGEDPTVVVLDTATGAVVADAVMPELPDAPKGGPDHLTPEGRFHLERGSGGDRVVAHATDSVRRLWEFPLEVDTAPGLVCLGPDRDAVVGHGDRLLVTRVCLDEDGHSDRGAHVVSSGGDVAESARVRVVVLDTVTGARLWSHEWRPRGAGPIGAATVREGRPGTDGEAVVVTGDGVLALETGEPVAGTGSGADAPAGTGVLAVDTAGAVVLTGSDEGEAVLVEETDAEGGVRRRTEVAAPGAADALGSPLLLADALVATGTGTLMAGEGPGGRSVLVAPLDGGTVTEEDLRWPRSDEESAPRSGDADHRLLAVPGAVVSFVLDADADGGRTAPVYGLLP
ncbi:hypothetical protein ABZ635_06150 [Nocardiopsis sp. NPDC007018]|uniref:hypothetical protein n=1 Tax=Nocardiopsis sp. NPDC007018 TaxID=3155721 RepID=UPI0033C5DF34